MKWKKYLFNIYIKCIFYIFKTSDFKIYSKILNFKEEIDKLYKETFRIHDIKSVFEQLLPDVNRTLRQEIIQQQQEKMIEEEKKNDTTERKSDTTERRKTEKSKKMNSF